MGQSRKKGPRQKHQGPPFPAEELFDGEEMTCWEEQLMKVGKRERGLMAPKPDF